MELMNTSGLFNTLNVITWYVARITLCVIIIYVIRYKVRNRRKELLAEKIPGPPALPIIGNTLQSLGSTVGILKHIDTLARTYPSPTRFWLGPVLVFIIHDPEDMQVVLHSNVALEKNIVYKFMEPQLGQGLLTAPVSIWRRHRRIIAPTFNSKVLETYFDVYNEQARKLVEKMEPNCGKEREFDVFDLVCPCTLDTACGTMMGVKLGAQDNKKEPYVKALLSTSSIISKRSFTIWMYPDWAFNLTRYGAIVRQALPHIHGLVSRVVLQRKDELRTRRLGEVEKEQIDGVRGHKRFLDHLLDLSEVENKLSPKEVHDEASTHIGAGFDTLAVLNSTVMLLLAIHQDEQARVYEELRNVFGDSDREVTMEDTKLMMRLDMVIKEVMRLFTIAPLFTRQLTEDLPVKNYILPKGSTLAIWTQTMHRNSDIYPEPDKFDPERFLPENIEKRHPYSFLPFSAGQRNCIGFSYASLMAKVLLATVFRKFHLHTNTKMEDIKLEHSVLQTAVDGYPIRLEKRKM